jgi:hypothetical protein
LRSGTEEEDVVHPPGMRDPVVEEMGPYYLGQPVSPERRRLETKRQGHLLEAFAPNPIPDPSLSRRM